MSKVAIVIPSYEPDERLIHLVNDLVNNSLGPIYIVNDGSGREYDSIFDTSYILKLIIEPNGQKDIKEVCNIITSNL